MRRILSLLLFPTVVTFINCGGKTSPLQPTINGCDEFQFAWFLSGKNMPDTLIQLKYYPQYKTNYRISKQALIDQTLVDSVAASKDGVLPGFCEIQFFLNPSGEKKVNEILTKNVSQDIVLVVNDEIRQITRIDPSVNSEYIKILYFTQFREDMKDVDTLVKKINCKVKLSRASN